MNGQVQRRADPLGWPIHQAAKRGLNRFNEQLNGCYTWINEALIAAKQTMQSPDLKLIPKTPSAKRTPVTTQEVIYTDEDDDDGPKKKTRASKRLKLSKGLKPSVSQSPLDESSQEDMAPVSTDSTRSRKRSSKAGGRSTRSSSRRVRKSAAKAIQDAPEPAMSMDKFIDIKDTIGEETVDSEGGGDVFSGQDDITAGQRDDSAGQRDISAGKSDVSVGIRNVSAGKRDVSAGKRDVAGGPADVTGGSNDVTGGQDDVTGGQAVSMCEQSDVIIPSGVRNETITFEVDKTMEAGDLALAEASDCATPVVAHPRASTAVPATPDTSPATEGRHRSPSPVPVTPTDDVTAASGTRHNPIALDEDYVMHSPIIHGYQKLKVKDKVSAYEQFINRSFGGEGSPSTPRALPSSTPCRPKLHRPVFGDVASTSAPSSAAPAPRMTAAALRGVGAGSPTLAAAPSPAPPAARKPAPSRPSLASTLHRSTATISIASQSKRATEEVYGAKVVCQPITREVTASLAAAHAQSMTSDDSVTGELPKGPATPEARRRSSVRLRVSGSKLTTNKRRSSLMLAVKKERLQNVTLANTTKPTQDKDASKSKSPTPAVEGGQAATTRQSSVRLRQGRVAQTMLNKRKVRPSVQNTSLSAFPRHNTSVINTSVTSYLRPGAANVNTSATSFLPNTPVKKPNPREAQEQMKKNLIARERQDDDRLQKRQQYLRHKVEEQRKKREERQTSATNRRLEQERRAQEAQRAMNDKFESTKTLSARVLEEKLKDEREKQKVREGKMAEAEARRRQDEEQRLIKQQEMKRYDDVMARKREFGEQKRVQEQRRLHEERIAEARLRDTESVNEKATRRLIEKHNSKLAEKQASLSGKDKMGGATGGPTGPPLNKTMTMEGDGKPSADVESYDLTPVRKVYNMKTSQENYDISNMKSDDSTDDETAPRKKIPQWASGIELKAAILNQIYHPPDLDTVFGIIPPLDLNQMFQKKKPRFNKRTSSAIWHSPLYKPSGKSQSPPDRDNGSSPV